MPSECYKPKPVQVRGVVIFEDPHSSTLVPHWQEGKHDQLKACRYMQVELEDHGTLGVLHTFTVLMTMSLSAGG